MYIGYDKPEGFPGAEFALRWPSDHPEITEYIYEECFFDYAQTTDGSTIVIPDISYMSYAEMKMGDEEDDIRYAHGRAPKIGVELLDESQANALEIAKRLEKMRDDEDPARNTFASLRRVAVAPNGIAYTTVTEEGSHLQGNDPHWAIESLKPLAVIDFATAVVGWYGMFKYDVSDIDYFIPREYRGRANAYIPMDEPRVITGPNGEHDYQTAKFMLCEVQSDLEYPIDDAFDEK